MKNGDNTDPGSASRWTTMRSLDTQTFGMLLVALFAMTVLAPGYGVFNGGRAQTPRPAIAAQPSLVAVY